MKSCNKAINSARSNRTSIVMSRSIKLIFTASIIVGLISGCTSTPTPRLNTNISPAEQNALNALRLHNSTEAIQTLDLALTEYKQIDDLYGRWRIQSLRAKLALGSSKLAEARKIAPTIRTISDQLNDNMVSYQTNILLGRIYLDDEYFHQALTYASTRLEQATVFAYLGEPQNSLRYVDDDKNDHPADRAFIFYQAGIASGSMKNFEQALDYYRMAEDSRGVADSLVRLARLSADSADTQGAKNYANRAVESLESSNHLQNANVIRNWAKTL